MSTTPNRPDILIGRKLPSHALWEQLLKRSRPILLDFCSQFLNGDLSYKQGQQWLADHGIKVSLNSLSGFYNSLEMRLRYASLEAERNTEVAKEKLPADLEAATRERIAQTMFEMAYMNLGENQRLQLIALQQNKDANKGSYELKKEKLNLDRAKFEFNAAKACLKQLPTLRAISQDKSLSETQKVDAIRAKLFGVLSK